MSEYILILLWLGLMSLIGSQVRLQRTELICGMQAQRYPWWFAFLVFLPVIIMAGTRTYFGDTLIYAINYLRIPDSFSDYYQTLTKDKGFYVYSYCIKQLAGKNYVFYFSSIALIQGIILLSVYRKYSSNYLLSIFLFIASTDYLSWMFNGMRQFTAVTIVFAATYWMLQKRYVPFVLTVLLASTFHQTAFMMIPCVFIAQGKAWNKKTLLFIAFALVIVTFVGSFTNMMDSALSDTQYKNVVSDYKSFQDDGTSFIRVLVYSIPAIISFFWRKKIQDARNPLINFCTNMSIISMGIYIISMFTSGIFIGRLPIYASLYSYILLPWETSNLFGRNSSGIINLGIVVCFLAFYLIQLISWGEL